MVDVLSFALGALAGVAASFVTAKGILRTKRETPQRATQRVSCEACGEPFESVDVARVHALDMHPAIDETNWDSIIRRN